MLGLVLGAACLFIGCGDSQDTAAENAEPAGETATETVQEVATALTAAEQEMVEKIAAIATAVEKAPAMAESIMEKAGMTAEEYEAAVYKIAESPALTESFEKAKGN